jgi:hypothetical protein
MAITINGTTGLSGVDGSAGTPALQGSDTNTGISFGTDEVNINTGGSTRATVDSSGRLLVGTSTASTPSNSAWTKLEINNADLPCALDITRNDQTVSTNSTLGIIRFLNNDDSVFQECANIQAVADGDFANNDKPTRLAFRTTAAGAGTTTEQMRLTSTGDLRFNSGYGSVATAYGCRAWVNFNGTGAVAIRASGNVSSITDNGTGAYTVNFATALVDANYAHEAQGSLTLTDGNLNHEAKTHTAATGSVKVRASNNTVNNTLGDQAEIRVTIFR